MNDQLFESGLLEPAVEPPRRAEEPKELETWQRELARISGVPAP